jgi:hypothetical protein
MADFMRHVEIIKLPGSEPPYGVAGLPPSRKTSSRKSCEGKRERV